MKTMIYKSNVGRSKNVPGQIPGGVLRKPGLLTSPQVTSSCM